MCVFFFKQKTAYEMRISDWSSDVCSSDLKSKTRRVGAGTRTASGCFNHIGLQEVEAHPRPRNGQAPARRQCRSGPDLHCAPARQTPRNEAADRRLVQNNRCIEPRGSPWLTSQERTPLNGRSAEHTSELQSLMRNSYAVFCLKTNTHIHYINQHET